MEMYMDSKEYIYTFAFNVLDNKYTLNVYSFDKQDILLFIHQHKFENGEEYIQLVPYEKNAISRYQDKMLKPFKFRSNSSDEEYTVMTTEFILEKCLTNAGDIITKSCWLSSILPEYNSMSLFNYINEAIEQLKYATVMDWQMMIDDSTCIELNPDVNKNIIMDKLMQSAYLNNIGEGFINEDVQEITIESYVNGFATLS
jgi:hypothetical protein